MKSAILKYTFTRKTKDKKLKVKVLVSYQGELVREVILNMNVE
jgi:hypothetical protein